MQPKVDVLQGSVLVVDDQAADVLVLTGMLRSAGFQRIASTTDPRTVCALHREHRYDLIILDLQMPGMDGFKVMDGLKAIETDDYLSVLVVTANPSHKMRALQSGAKDFVSKPFDAPEVLVRVHNLLEVRLLHQASRDQSKLLESLALHDALTGLANRRLLADRMSMALAHARRHTSALAVVYLDLDGFKRLNDARGHGAGDALLRQVAQRLVALVREEDTVARAGGDEFILLLWHISGPEYATAVALKVLAALAVPFIVEGHSVSISASAGVSIYPDHGEDAETLTKSADRALYEAKRAGKNVHRISGGTVSLIDATAPTDPTDPTAIDR